MSTVIRFRRPPHVELNGGVITGGDRPELVGQVRYFIDYHDEDGETFGVWDGPTYGDAIAALQVWQQNGVPAVNLIGEAL